MTDPTQKSETAATDAGRADTETATAAAAASAVAVKKDAKAKKAGAPESTIVVTGPEKGRWRAGRKFTREPSSIQLSDLATGDLEKLQADPELHVQVIDAPH